MVYDVYMPEYYPKFQCIGAACANHCCQQWRVSLSKADYDRLRALRAGKEVVELLRKATRRCKDEPGLYAEMVLDDTGRCTCQDGEGLCLLQKACGHEVLPAICKEFPRVVTYYQDIGFGKRVGTPGCEVVTRALLDAREGLGFIHEQVPKPEPLARVKPHVFQKAVPLGRHFWEMQGLFIDILQNRSYRIEERMLLLGVAFRGLTEVLEAKESKVLESWLRRTALMGEGDGCRELLDGLKGNHLLAAASHLQLFHQHGGALFRGLREAILARYGVEVREESEGGFRFDGDAVATARAEFEAGCPQGLVLLENLMVNYLFQSQAPFEREDPWEDFQVLASIFSLLRFVMFSVYRVGDDPDALVGPVTQVCRTLLHSEGVKKYLVDMHKASDSQSLGHMALLIL